MATSIRNVRGFAELEDRLKALPKKLSLGIARGGMRAGAQAMRKEVLARVPIGPPNSENVRLYGGYEGALRDTVRVSSRVDMQKGEVTAKVVAGGESKKGADVFYAHMSEFGTAAHLIKPLKNKKDGVLAIQAEADGVTGEMFAPVVEHPGTKPTHFMSRSLIAGEHAFVNAVKEYIRNRLDKDLVK